MKNERRDGIAVMWDNRNKDSNNEGTEIRVLIEMNLTKFNMTQYSQFDVAKTNALTTIA